MPRKTTPIEERFASKHTVNQSTGCWEWQGSKNYKGYGYLWGGASVGKKLAAHRVSYEIYLGPIRDGMVVGHTCDNPSCVNPEHLQIMSYQENMEDKISKGRAGGNGWGFRRTGVVYGSQIRHPSRKELFMDMVAENENGCWIWQGSTNEHGYGVTSLCGKQERAHRAAWLLFKGEIPGGDGYHGTCVRHKCDVRSCCNPDHLELGSHQDNMDDMFERDRRPPPKGERNPASKLSANDVQLIRQFLERWPARPGGKGLGAGSCRFLARWFGVHVMTIVGINKGKTWKEDAA